jgi:hypothetical protein
LGNAVVRCIDRLSEDYDFNAFKSVYSDLLSSYGEVCILGHYNVELLDPGRIWFELLSDLLETFVHHNVAISMTRRATSFFFSV